MPKSAVPEWFAKDDPGPGGGGDGGGAGCVIVAAALVMVGAGALVFVLSARGGSGTRPATEPAARQAPAPTAPALDPPTPVVAPSPEPAPEVAVPPTPAPGPSAAEPSGGELTAADVRGVFQKNQTRFRACYESVLTYAPKARGKAHLTVDIQASGRVARATVDLSGELPSRLSPCMVKVAESLRFPKSDRDTKVGYPFTFSSAP